MSSAAEPAYDPPDEPANERFDEQADARRLRAAVFSELRSLQEAFTPGRR